MSERFRDYDEFQREQTADPLVITWDGREWELPADIPADLVLNRARLRASLFELQQEATLHPDREVTDADAETIKESLRFDVIEESRKAFGDALVDEWLDCGMGLRTLKRIYADAMDFYETGDRPGEDDEGDEDRPTQAPRGTDQRRKQDQHRRARKSSSSSSNAGSRSKPTGSASTGETSVAS